MAEGVALYLVQKIGDTLIAEGIARTKSLIDTLQKVHGEMRNIKRRLELMQVFLQYGDKYSTEDKLVATWVKQVRELSLDIEDLVDEYTYIMTRQRKMERDNFVARAYRGFNKSGSMKALIAIADELHNCNNTLRDLWEDRNTFGIDLKSGNWEKALSESKEVAEAAHTIPDENIVGVKDYKDKLIEWLEDDKESERVITVWGMGGVGKTTLVSSVYNSPAIVSHFGCRAWVTVSQNYSRDDIIRRIIRDLNGTKPDPSSSIEPKQDPSSCIELKPDPSMNLELVKKNKESTNGRLSKTESKNLIESVRGLIRSQSKDHDKSKKGTSSVIESNDHEESKKGISSKSKDYGKSKKLDLSSVRESNDSEETTEGLSNDPSLNVESNDPEDRKKESKDDVKSKIDQNVESKDHNEKKIQLVSESKDYEKNKVAPSSNAESNNHDERKKDLLSSLDSKSYKDLAVDLENLLKQKRYLIVLDDVWASTTWHDLVNIISEKSDKNGRVIITTRHHEVACVTDKSYILEIKPLKTPKAKEIFYRNLFRHQKNKHCPTKLERWGNKIVDKCGGLPLALVWVANHLATKEQSETSWKNVYEKLSSLDDKNELMGMNRINIILSLSITMLPYYLRSCFLYCSIFPEDYAIKRKKLLRLWVSEGFIENERVESSKMEVAEDYLNQLVSRSMFQVVKRNKFGRVKTLKIHDFVREIIIKKQQYESFYETWDMNMERRLNREKARYLSIIKLDDKDYNNSQHHDTSQLRTLHMFSKSTSYLPMRNFKLLRILNLDGSKIQSLPKEIGILFNLRYLSTRNTEVERLPKDICKLQNLETLDIGHCQLKNMSERLSKLERLQHLMGTNINGDDVKGIRNFKCLQTLKEINATDKLVEDLASLIALRTLNIHVFTAKQSIQLFAAINMMKHLVNLKIYMDEQCERYVGGPGEFPHELEKLTLVGSLDNLCFHEEPSEIPEGDVEKPLEWPGLPKCLHSTTNNLKSLTLSGSNLGEDPIPALSRSSPNLCYLNLRRCFKLGVDKLCFPKGSFASLKTLKMKELTKVEMVEIQVESLVGLERMQIFRCWGMRELPTGIENLSKLKRFDWYPLSDELKEEIDRERYNKLRHIELINRVYREDDGGVCHDDETLLANLESTYPTWRHVRGPSVYELNDVLNFDYA